MLGLLGRDIAGHLAVRSWKEQGKKKRSAHCVEVNQHAYGEEAREDRVCSSAVAGAACRWALMKFSCVCTHHSKQGTLAVLAGKNTGCHGLCIQRGRRCVGNSESEGEGEGVSVRSMRKLTSMRKLG